MIIETRELVSPEGAAELLGISYRRVAQLVEAGELPAVHDSSRRRTFRVEDLEALAHRRAARKAQERKALAERRAARKVVGRK
jgi:excisionase family DNA binding protein